MEPGFAPVPIPDFRALFAAAPGLLLVLDRDLRIVAATDGYLQATMTVREDIFGRDIFDVFPDNPDDPTATGVSNLRKSLMTVLETRKADVMAVQKYDIRRPEAEGGGFEERYWSPRNAPVLGSNGEVRYIIHQVADVTNLVRLNSQIVQSGDSVPPTGAIGPEEMIAQIGKLVTTRNQLEAQLRQAQKMEAIGRLAGGIAHDFNNLLTVILGYSGILKDSVEGEANREGVEQIERAAGRAAALTGQLLAFSRKQVLQLRMVDLNGVVGGMQEFMQRLIGEDITLKIELDSTLPHVKADPGQLEQVLMNLVVNARDAMPHGGRLTISTRALNYDAAELGLRPVAGDRFAVLTVTDSGEGMNAETRSRIFEPFFTTKESGKGTGLGLSTVFGVVEQCGGTISVESEPGHGAAFTILLPAGSERAEAGSAPAGTTQKYTGSGTVLLVEDEESLRRLVRGMLDGAGYQVIEARNGAEGLAISHDYPKSIDLLVTDVVMPGMSGPEMAARLQKDRPGMMVLFMSGYDNHTIEQPLSGPVHCIAKPFTRKSLMEKVGMMLGKRRASGIEG